MQTTQYQTQVVPRPRKYKVLFRVFLVLFVALLAATAFLWTKYKKTVNELRGAREELEKRQATPENVDATQEVVSKVGQLIVLPSDEQPTIATVSDVEKLRSQPFFANAQDGDKVLIYAKAKKAILFRPSANKVIEIAPLSGAEPPAPVAPPAQ